MTMINYLHGDATSICCLDNCNKMIIHVCNNKGGFGAGFVLSLSKKWKSVEYYYKKHINELELGDVQFITVEPKIVVANMIAQNGYRSYHNPIPLSYDALEKCLISVREYCIDNDYEIHAPKFGAGLAGGNWEYIEGMIIENICNYGIAINIYEI